MPAPSAPPRTPAPPMAPLWMCDRCGRGFANRNQSHACGRYDLAPHFAGTAPAVREIYDAFVAAIEAIGPVTILPEKTRIAFQVRMSFTQITTRKSYVRGHLVLARRADDAIFICVETFSPRNHLHAFRLNSVEEVGGKFLEYLREAYAVGCQDHLGPRNE